MKVIPPSIKNIYNNIINQLGTSILGPSIFFYLLSHRVIITLSPQVVIMVMIQSSHVQIYPCSTKYKLISMDHTLLIQIGQANNGLHAHTPNFFSSVLPNFSSNMSSLNSADTPKMNNESLIVKSKSIGCSVFV
jgi:hypothetical protein